MPNTPPSSVLGSPDWYAYWRAQDKEHIIANLLSFSLSAFEFSEKLMGLKDVLRDALKDSPCAADSDIHTVANDCTEGKCWHARAKKLLEG